MSTTGHHHHVTRPRRIAGVIAMLVAIGVAGCGGSGSGSGPGSSRDAANATPGSSVAPLAIGAGAAAGPGVATARYGVKASQAHGNLPLATKASQAPSHAFFERSVRTKDSEETTPSSQRIINPCALVTRSEVSAALGGRIIKVTKAPLGPTCVYQGATQRAFASVAVQVRPFAKLASQNRSLRKFAGIKRAAYCGGTAGATVLYVRVGSYEVLQITAPCQTGAKLAAHALGRLRGAPGVAITNP
jgi:hypothetical protein